jgi:hypothetical protein
VTEACAHVLTHRGALSTRGAPQKLRHSQLKMRMTQTARPMTIDGPNLNFSRRTRIRIYGSTKPGRCGDDSTWAGICLLALRSRTPFLVTIASGPGIIG